jgi:acid phosphatase
MTNYYAVTHPSQPNYWSQVRTFWFLLDSGKVAGSYFDIRSDNPHDLPHTNLVDLMDGKVSWKAYEENYPGNCYSSYTNGKYYRKHNPFISFNNIRNNATRCAKVSTIF